MWHSEFCAFYVIIAGIGYVDQLLHYLMNIIVFSHLATHCSSESARNLAIYFNNQSSITFYNT